MDERVKVARIGGEGGAGWLYCKESDGESVYWFEGTCMKMDADDNEYWGEWRTLESPDIALAFNGI